MPTTATLRAAPEALPVVPREGYVVRNVDGSALGQVQMDETMRRIVRRAGLPSHRRTWHALRHTFATDCARYGVNPWTLQNWFGHKRIEETMRYVHVAQDHWRETPEEGTHSCASSIRTAGSSRRWARLAKACHKAKRRNPNRFGLRRFTW
jgi:site-specific recombinase XerD